MARVVKFETPKQKKVFNIVSVVGLLFLVLLGFIKQAMDIKDGGNFEYILGGAFGLCALWYWFLGVTIVIRMYPPEKPNK